MKIKAVVKSTNSKPTVVPCMMKRVVIWLKKSKKLTYLSKNPLYASHVTKIKESYTKKTPHGAVRVEFTYRENFESWITREMESGSTSIYSVTSKPHKNATFTCKKKGRLISQYYRDYSNVLKKVIHITPPLKSKPSI